jgi:hypothetical protein
MTKAALYTRYPINSILIYNGSTILHFLVGSVILSFSSRFFGVSGIVFASLYFTVALAEMYIFMPLQVCRNCTYFRLGNSLCISGLNVPAKKFFKEGNPSDFPKRAQGIFCPNNLYLASLIFPLLCGVLILIFHFSTVVFVLEIGLFLLLVARFFLIIPKLACVHCLSKFMCPQAGQMGVREK